MPIEPNGDFWIVGEGDRLRGAYYGNVGQPLQVTLQGVLREDPTVTVTRSESGTTQTRFSMAADKAVASFAPKLLHGKLDSGEEISLLYAHNHGGSGHLSPPRYQARTVVIGTHVQEDQRYGAVRFKIDAPHWTEHLAGEAPQRLPDGSMLSAEPSNDGVWLAYRSATPRSLRDLEQRVVSGGLALAQLALDVCLKVRASEVLIDGGSWLPVHGTGFRSPSTKYETPLLEPTELTLERFARWIALNASLDGLAWGVIQPVQGAIQEQALVATSLIEGIHRRLPYPQSQFPGMTGWAKERIRRAARGAAEDRARHEDGVTPSDIKDAVNRAVARFDDVDYESRVRDIADEVLAVVPELGASIPEFPAKLKKARNDLAHHLIRNEEYDDVVEVLDHWIVVSMVTPWLLRVLLLLRAGVDPEKLRRSCMDYQRFRFVLANIAATAHDLGWNRAPSKP